MFLGVSHIANCLFSMFHRIWILVVFWCPVCHIIKHPCSKKHSGFFSLSNLLTHTRNSENIPLVAQQAGDCAFLSDETYRYAMRIGTLKSPMVLPLLLCVLNLTHFRIWGYMDPLDESFLKFCKTIGMSRKKRSPTFWWRFSSNLSTQIWNSSFTSRNSTSPSTTKTQHGPHLDQSFLSDGILLALPRQLGHHMENVRSIPCQGSSWYLLVQWLQIPWWDLLPLQTFKGGVFSFCKYFFVRVVCHFPKEFSGGMQKKKHWLWVDRSTKSN